MTILASPDVDGQVDGQQDDGDYLFFSTKDKVRCVYAWLDGAVLLFGLLLNLLLVHIIRTKTVPGMHIYKKLLMISCIMDLVMSICTFIAQPIPVVHNGYRTILLNGIFRYSSQPIQYAVYLVWIQLTLFFLVTTMSQYVYRFCILCRNEVMPPSIFWSLITFQVVLNIFHGCLLAWADYPRAEEIAKMVELKRSIGTDSGITDIHFVSFVNAQAFRWIVHITLMCLMFPCFYFIIIVCVVRIRKVINAMNPFKLDYNNQVSAALLFQALLPTFEVVALSIQVFVPIFVTQNTLMFIVFSDIPIHLIPVLNPIGTILLVAPYRRALFHSCGWLKKALSRTKVHTIGPTTGPFVSSTLQVVPPEAS